MKAEVEIEVEGGNFGVHCCEPNKLYVHTMSNLVDGSLYSIDRLKAVLVAATQSMWWSAAKKF